MRSTRCAMRLLCVIACLMLAERLARAADWPAYRGSSARTAKTSEKLKFPLSLAWKYVPARRHQPAWPDKFLREQAGMSFDYAPQVAIAAGVIYFGSSTDNTLWALDGATGRTKWGFTTGGPIRFAPAIWKGKVYVVSDDGVAYCLDAATGKQIWKFFGGLYDSRMIGNRRMISRWPIRSGVVVDDGMVNFAVGMWTSEGVYVYALDAKTGKVIWCNDTNIEFTSAPHFSDNMHGNMPQGYMAASKDKIVFNNGHAGCFVYDRKSGKKLAGKNWASELPPTRRGNSAELVMNEDGTFFYGGYVDRRGKRGVHHPDVRENWALAGDTLIRCDKNQVIASIGPKAEAEPIWLREFKETPAGLAVGNGMLLVSTIDGSIHCFRPVVTGKPATVGPGARPMAKTAPGPAASVLQTLAACKMSKGYALVLGHADAKLAEALASNSQFQVICVLSDKAKVDSERKRLLATTGIYGARITVDRLMSREKLPYPPYFANVIVAAKMKMPSGLPAAEIRRVQRPCGGLIIGDGKVGFRGRLEGAYDWDSKVSADQRVKWPLEMLWFGQPGPMNTGGKGCGPPIPVSGVALYTGNPYLIALDAYNSTELWRWKVPDKKRYRMTVDGRYVNITLSGAGKNERFVLDVDTGLRVNVVGGPGVTPGPRRSLADRALYSAPMRTHPLTGGKVSKSYARSHGCRGVASSAAMDFFRSGSFGYYDYDDDSGIRNLSGLRPACGVSKTAALGLLLVADGQGAPSYSGGGCDCRFNFLGALALAPARRQRNEDWSIFADTVPHLTAGAVRHANMNFGAVGDRRHTDKKLWLAAPRPRGDGYKGHFMSMAIPYQAEFYAGPQIYRRNADRLAIEGTERPWVYTSGYRGLKSLTVNLDYYDWRYQHLAPACQSAPSIDGELTEACWDGVAEAFLVKLEPGKADTYTHLIGKPGESAFLRHDKDNLYVAYRRIAVAGDRRKPQKPWKAKTSGKDAKVWNDDCFEMLIRGQGENVVHLGVSASGAIYDALIKTTGPLGGNSVRWKGKESVADVSWNGVWRSAASLKKDQFVIEAAIPWKTLEDLGISRTDMSVLLHQKLNIKYLKRPAVKSINMRVRLSDQDRLAKPYTVRLHFAELVNRSPARRVFDVKLQGETVLKNFDILSAASGMNKAIVKEFKGVMALDTLKLELVSDAADMTGPSATIISGMQIVAEKPGPVPPPVIGRMSTGRGSSSFRLQAEIDKLTDKQRKGARFVDPLEPPETKPKRK
jgi:outer membrane protein assembly factor BamB